MEPLLQIGNLCLSWALFGLIWTVQLVHYPSFRYITDFSSFHLHHTTSISVLVGPLMAAELFVTAWLAWEKAAAWPWLLPLLLVLVIWGLTFFWAVPLHERLSRVPSEKLIDQLLLANWFRTIFWTIKAIWVSLLFYTRIQSVWV